MTIVIIVTSNTSEHIVMMFPDTPARHVQGKHMEYYRKFLFRID